MTHAALPALLAVEPQWVDVVPAAQALDLLPGELLHAGPPLRDPLQPPPVLASSTVLTSLHEGWFADAAEVEAALARGDLALSPAQARGCVTPLACVVSAGTPLLRVVDARRPDRAFWAPLSAVRGPDTRMGGRQQAVLERLRHRDEVLAPALRQLLRASGPVALLPPAARGLVEGDDLHSRTQGANDALAEAVRQRGARALAEDIAASPLFFLTPWMAACALMLRAAEGGDRPGIVTRGGGNGEVFGLALAGRPDHWILVPADPPRGPRVPGASLDAPVARAIGDSAVVDLLGLGGQRLAHAPEPYALVSAWLDDPNEEATRWLAAAHPGLRGCPVGLDVARLPQSARPRIMLALLGADGRQGLLGRGVLQPPAALWREAAVRAGA